MVDSPSHQEFIDRFEEGRLSALADLASGKYGYVEYLLRTADELIGRRLGRGYGKEDAIQSLYRVLARDFQEGRGRKKRRKFKHSGALRRFLARVLGNRIRNRGARKPTEPLSSVPWLIDIAGDRDREAKEAKELVDAAISELTPKQQEICRLRGGLHDGKRLSRRRVAEVVGCSEQTVDRAMERFASAVRGRLKREDGDCATEGI